MLLASRVSKKYTLDYVVVKKAVWIVAMRAERVMGIITVHQILNYIQSDV